MQQHVLHLGIQVRARRRRRAKPAGIVAQCEADATRPRGARFTRLEHRPHDLAGETQAVEPLALIVLRARHEQVLLPDPRGKVLTLQQLDGGEHARRPGQPMLGMQMVSAQ